MLLTISLTPPPEADWPATDLGYLLAKNPARVQDFALPFGTARVFYAEADEARCTAALLVEVDPIELMRQATRERRGEPEAATLASYVNDRPYAASSLLSVAIARVLGSALRGRCEARPELAAACLPLRVTVPAVPVSLAPGEAASVLVAGLFEPLGWQVTAVPVPLDPVLATLWESAPGASAAGTRQTTDWREARHVDLELAGTMRLAEALSHLYVLLPVLDSAKHYRMSGEEVDKLLRAGEGWLAAHPEREFITRRYLRHRRALVATALDRLAEADQLPLDALAALDEEPVEEPVEEVAADEVADAAEGEAADE